MLLNITHRLFKQAHLWEFEIVFTGTEMQLPSPSMVHLLRSTVLELITPTSGNPSTSPAGSLGRKLMPLPSSGVTAAGSTLPLPSARLVSLLRVTPLALRISTSEPQVSSRSAKPTLPWMSDRACRSCAPCRWSWFLFDAVLLVAMHYNENLTQTRLFHRTCSGCAAPPDDAAGTGSEPPPR